MRQVKVEDSVGMIVGHDMTRVIPEQFKGVAFKKGHIIRQEDIEILKKMGKDHIYILEINEGQIHEDEAALRLGRAAAGRGITLTEPSEGKVSFIADYRGLLKVDIDLLVKVNSNDMISMAMLHNNTPVEKGMVVAGTRIIPLVIDESVILNVEEICQDKPLVCVKPFKRMKFGAVITGNEVFYGRIQDKFAPVIRNKLEHYDSELLDVVYVPDNTGEIRDAILRLVDMGCEGIVTAGGMSVDPDDVTPEGIRQTGARLVSYGAPVFPGAMFLMAYLGEIPIMGIPACGMYHKTTVFDLVLCKVLAGETIHKSNLAILGHGGLCLNCRECRFPNCSFGKY